MCLSSPHGHECAPSALCSPRQTHIAPNTQEFQTIADRANFEIKKKLMTRLSYGIGIYLGATVGVMLLPIFVNDYLQVGAGRCR